MIKTIVCPEMILQSCIGMFHSNIIECAVSCGLSSPEKQFQIHHIINDNNIIIRFAIMGFNAAYHRAETGN